MRDAYLDGGATNILLPAVVASGPCTNLASYVGGELRPKRTSDQGVTCRFNLAWETE